MQPTRYHKTNKLNMLSKVIFGIFVLLTVSVLGMFLENTLAGDWESIEELEPETEVPMNMQQTDPSPCSGTLQVIVVDNTRPIRVGDRVKIVVQLLSNAHLVGRVDVQMGQDPPVSMTQSDDSRYTYFWEIPSHATGRIPIMFFALARQGGEVICDGEKRVTIEKSLSVTISGPSKMITGTEEVFTVRVSGGKAPYIYEWDISGYPSQTYQSPDPVSIRNIKAIKGQGLFSSTVTVTDSENNKRAVQHFAEVYTNTSILQFDKLPENLKVNQKFNYKVYCRNTTGNGTHRIEFDWGDNSEPSVSVGHGLVMTTSKKHAYRKAGKYHLRVRVISEQKTGGSVDALIHVKSSNANIIQFIGPEKLKKGDEGRFKVKINPGSASLTPYRYTFIWGDSSSEINTDKTQVMDRHIFFESKKYKVIVRVNDNLQNDQTFIADEAVINVAVVDKIPLKANLGDTGWKHHVNNPSPLLIKLKATNIDPNKEYTDIRVVFKNPTTHSIGVTISEVIRTGPGGIEENLGQYRSNIGMLYPNDTRHDRIRVYVKKDGNGEYHGKLLIKYRTYGRSNMKFELTTQSKR